MGWQDAPLAAYQFAPAADPTATPAPAANDQSSPKPTAAKSAWETAPIVAPPDNTDVPTELVARDSEAPQPLTRFSDADTAALQDLYKTGNAEDIKAFIANRGGQYDGPGIDTFVKARDQAKAQGLPIDYDVSVAFPKVQTNAGGAVVRGAGQGATLGLSDELHGAGAGIASALTGGSYTDAYDRTVDADRSLLAADQEQHPYASLGGNLAGGLLVPFAGEESGLVRGIPEVAQDAYRSARLEGFTADEARVIAQRTVARRVATEGAAYGAAYGAGSADGGPGERLTGALEGGVTGGLLGAGLGYVGSKVAPALYDARVAARALPADPIPDAALVGQAADRQGIAILPQDVGGRGIIRSTQGAAQSPFGAKVVGQAADRLYDSFGGRVGELAGDAPAPVDAGNVVGARAADSATRAAAAADRSSQAVQDAVATPTDSTGAGQLIQRGVSRFMDDTADKASELYQAVPIAADQPAQLGTTRRLLNDLTSEWASNPKLGALFQNGRLSGYLDALTPNATKADTGLLDAAGKPITRDVTEGGSLNWQDLSEFRTRVGDMLANPRLDEKIAPRQLNALYGALTTDMKATAQAAGPNALARWTRANNFYDGRMKRINDTFSMVLGARKDATPNEAYSAVQSMLKPGSTGNAAAFSRIMRSMSPEDASTVRASIVNDARGGRQFDPDAFAKSWGQLSERGKSALLPQPGMRTIMDDAAGRAALNTRNPFVGLSGEQVYSKLETMAGTKGDANRFQATLNSLSPDEANAVRSTFIDRMGRAAPGAQNAEGDAFSIARWLTRWNTMTPEAQTALFGRGELRSAMQDLATVADRVKASEKLAGHSNTGGILEANKTNAALWTAIGSLLTGHPIVAAGLAMPAVYQRISAEVMTSPRLLRFLTRVPKQADRAGQYAYLSKLQTIAAREPRIADSALALREYLRTALDGVPGRAAASENVGNGRQAPPDKQDEDNGQN